MSEHRNTPESVVGAVRAWRAIGLDPCSNRTSVVGARVEYCLPQQDGLDLPWHGMFNDEVVFVNPDWRKHLLWVDKAIKEGVPTLYWGPAYTESAWGKRLITSCLAVCFWGKRVKHPDPWPEINPKTGKPKGDAGSMWPTMLVALNFQPSEARSFCEHFRQYGTCMVPWAYR